MVDVFISYQRADKPEARALAQLLLGLGFEVWWDVDLLPGQRFAEEINNIISKASAVVVLWSSGSVQSDWVKAEASLGLKREVLIPAWLEKVDLPVPFNAIHTLNLTDWNGTPEDPAVEPLLRAIRSHAGKGSKHSKPRSDAEVKLSLNAPAMEAEFWISVSTRTPQSPSEYEAYIEKFGPNANFYELAVIRIDELKARSSSKEASFSLFGVTTQIPRYIAISLTVLASIVFVWWNWQDIDKSIGASLTVECFDDSTDREAEIGESGRSSSTPAKRTAVRPVGYFLDQPLVRISIDDSNVITREDEECLELTWHFENENRVALSRIALNELRYKYYIRKLGEYTVYLSCLIEGRERGVSNVITYRID